MTFGFLLSGLVLLGQDTVVIERWDLGVGGHPKVEEIYHEVNGKKRLVKEIKYYACSWMWCHGISESKVFYPKKERSFVVFANTKAHDTLYSLPLNENGNPYGHFEYSDKWHWAKQNYKMSGNYIDGFKAGVWEEFGDSNKLATRIKYDHDSILTETRWHENGQVSWYFDSLGNETSYYENGLVYSSLTSNTVYQYFSETGNLLLRIEPQNNGWRSYKEWNNKGDLMVEAEYQSNRNQIGCWINTQHKLLNWRDLDGKMKVINGTGFRITDRWKKRSPKKHDYKNGSLLRSTEANYSEWKLDK